VCNRYSSTKNEAKLQLKRAAIALATLFVRYNIAPTSLGPVVTMREGQLIEQTMRWGVRGYDRRLLTNAKSESARHKPMWRNAWGQRRCVIPADGYYEWKTEGRRKLPYRMVLKDDSLFWFAGLFEEDDAARDDMVDRSELRASTECTHEYVILTREPTSDLRSIHNRMPLILRTEEIESWLALETSREWVPEGLREGSLRCYRVGSAVGTPGFETPECIAPLVGAMEQGELW
jgi:putative SOS response-associated peptidase YedK